jgi:Icc protein
MSFRIAQISDTHLSPLRNRFVDNFQRVAEALRTRGADLVVNTGDVTLDGADDIRDLSFARELHAAIGLPWLAVPGNHDVGDDPTLAPRQPIDSTRLARYRAALGSDRFLRDVPGWRLIGINGLLADAALPETADQFEFLRAAVADAGARSIALFLHKPLTLGGDDPDGTYWRMRDTGRAALRAAFGTRRPRLVASGHLHQFRRIDHEGTMHIWAPSTAFIVADRAQQRFGTKLVGYVTHDLGEDGHVSVDLATVDGLALDDIAALPEIYGEPPARDATAPGTGAA